MKRKLRRIKRKLKKSKYVLIILTITIIVLIIVFTIIGNNIVKEKEEYDELVNESYKINNSLKINSYNLSYINQLSSSQICTSKYNKILEEAIEEYTREYSLILDDTIKSIKDEKYANLLVASNYQADAPEFKNSINYINEKNKEIDSLIEKLNNTVKKDNYMKYINSRTDNIKTIERYKILINNINNKDEISLLNNDVFELKEILKVSNDIFVYLGRNNNAWHVENNEIIFTKQEVKNEYDKAIAKIKK